MGSSINTTQKSSPLHGRTSCDYRLWKPAHRCGLGAISRIT